MALLVSGMFWAAGYYFLPPLSVPPRDDAVASTKITYVGLLCGSTGSSVDNLNNSNNDPLSSNSIESVAEIEKNKKLIVDSEHGIELEVTI